MLRVEGLSVSYGDARVLEGISFQVKPGAMTCILGPNGAGKTTLLRSITGIIPSVVGKVWFLDQEIQGKKTHQIVELGMTMIPEGRRLWAPLSIQENLELGAYRISDQRIVPPFGRTKGTTLRNPFRGRTTNGIYWPWFNGFPQVDDDG
jgi:branched-chain amino acid transport system ATP-binding protein